MIQYRHCREKTIWTSRGTIAIEFPKKQQLEKMILKGCELVSLNVGVAIFSEKDKHFEKAKGREVATKRMDLVLFELVNLTIKDEKLFFNLQAEVKVGNRFYPVSLELYYGAKYEKVYLKDGVIWSCEP